MKLLDIVRDSISILITCTTKEQWSAIVGILFTNGWINESEGNPGADTFEQYPNIVLYGDNREYLTLSDDIVRPADHTLINPDEFIKANS